MAEESNRPLRFLSIEQVAQELNVGEPLVRGMLKSGELRGIQLGGRGYLAHLLRLMRICS